MNFVWGLFILCLFSICNGEEKSTTKTESDGEARFFSEFLNEISPYLPDPSILGKQLGDYFGSWQSMNDLSSILQSVKAKCMKEQEARALNERFQNLTDRIDWGLGNLTNRIDWGLGNLTNRVEWGLGNLTERVQFLEDSVFPKPDSENRYRPDNWKTVAGAFSDSTTKRYPIYVHRKERDEQSGEIQSDSVTSEDSEDNDVKAWRERNKFLIVPD